MTPLTSVVRRDALIQRYGLAVLSVVTALAVALLLEQFRFRDAAIPLFLFAAAASSWYGGPGPALLAVGLSSLSFDFFFVPPLYTFYVAVSDVPYMIIFAAFAALASLFSPLRHRALAHSLPA